MLSALLSLLGSNALGSFLGWIGGAFNRYIDLKNRDKDLETLKSKQQHELDMRDKDLEMMKEEWNHRLAVSKQETETAAVTAHGQVETAAYNAMAESYKDQMQPSGIKWVDGFSKMIRPIATIWFLILSSWASAYIVVSAEQAHVSFTVAEWHDWVTYVIHWVFFQAGVITGWWFANRPSEPPPKK